MGTVNTSGGRCQKGSVSSTLTSIVNTSLPFMSKEIPLSRGYMAMNNMSVGDANFVSAHLHYIVFLPTPPRRRQNIPNNISVTDYFPARHINNTNHNHHQHFFGSTTETQIPPTSACLWLDWHSVLKVTPPVSDSIIVVVLCMQHSADI